RTRCRAKTVMSSPPGPRSPGRRIHRAPTFSPQMLGLMLIRHCFALSLLLVSCAGDSDNPTGAAGAASGGTAGHAGAGGSAAGAAGTSAGTGGVTAGAGGTASGGAAAGGTSGGAAGGTSGAAGAGGGGVGGGGVGGGSGSGGCTPVSLGSLLAVDTEAGGSSLAFSVVGANATQDHVLYIEFFDVGGAPTAGSFDLSQPPDDNYSTC